MVEKVFKEFWSYKLPGQLCLVSVWKRLLDCQDDAVGNDGEQDGVFERGPFYQKPRQKQGRDKKQLAYLAQSSRNRMPGF